MAPLIAMLFSKGLATLGEAVLAKGKDFIEDKLGVNLEESVKSEQGLIQLRQLEYQHEEFLIKSSAEETKMFLEDVKSARSLAVELSKSTSWLNQNIMPILAIGTLVASMVVLWFAHEADVKMAAVSFITMVLSFFFGSSKGSKDKQEQLYKVQNDPR